MLGGIAGAEEHLLRDALWKAGGMARGGEAEIEGFILHVGFAARCPGLTSTRIGFVTPITPGKTSFLPG